MKKFYILIISFCVICAVLILLPFLKNDAPVPSSPDPTQPPVTQVCPDDVIAVAVPVTTEEQYDDNGTLLFQYMYQNIYLTMPDQTIADKIIIDFLNRVDKGRSVAENLAQQAQIAYDGSANWAPYMYQTTYSPTRIDKGVLSLLGTNVSVYGGPHPERTHVAANYDMLTGEMLTLGSVLSHIDKAPELCDLLLEALSDIEKEKFLYPGYQDSVKGNLLGNESSYERFYFAPGGLCFFFSHYEIAPYISGLITVEIPYAKLTGIINDAYFPEEVETATGDITPLDFSQEALSHFSQFSEIVLNKEGTKILLHPDEKIHNVRIETGYWNLNGNVYIPEQTVFAAAALCQYDAIMLQDIIPDAMPTLRITFDSLGKTTSYYITQDNGAILLLPA